eukprot:scaffold628642_cov42-Prasinocladus_malaysianus.AAC.1
MFIHRVPFNDVEQRVSYCRLLEVLVDVGLPHLLDLLPQIGLGEAPVVMTDEIIQHLGFVAARPPQRLGALETLEEVENLGQGGFDVYLRLI